jgi:hypothetical protein
MEPCELYQEMREACARVAEARGMDRECFNWAALLSLVHIRNGMIRDDWSKRKRKSFKTDKSEIAEKYGVTANYVSRIVYGEK